MQAPMVLNKMEVLSSCSHLRYLPWETLKERERERERGCTDWAAHHMSRTVPHAQAFFLCFFLAEACTGMFFVEVYCGLFWCSWPQGHFQNSFIKINGSPSG